ncbi:hypothetical protein [Sporosarcina jiandibaonis]|uniref:hypothetical protein n=1 Tax=Sporosarcina jiandibaonis TaxID=2715535 RepID=UPI0015572965|nr:hypothetical protein [Sporosarcina jiandibaonis]
MKGVICSRWIFLIKQIGQVVLQRIKNNGGNNRENIEPKLGEFIGGGLSEVADSINRQEMESDDLYRVIVQDGIGEF